MLEIENKIYENLIISRILKQGDEIKRGSGLIFTASNGIELYSVTRPGWYDTHLCVRGVLPSKDNWYFMYEAPDETIAIKLVEDIKLAVLEYNQSLSRLTEGKC